MKKTYLRHQTMISRANYPWHSDSADLLPQSSHVDVAQAWHFVHSQRIQGMAELKFCARMV